MRNHPLVLQHLATAAPADCVISTITRYELLVGVEKSANPIKERAKVDLLVRTCRQMRFDVPAAEHAAKVRAFLERQGAPIGPYDTLLAGHALSQSFILVSANVKEFSRVPGLTLENWEI